MLKELRIKNFAIIEDLTLSFSKGLNVLSGETGAGKSIIMGALALLLGGKASAEIIRSSEEEAVVEALFELESCSAINRQLEAWGIAGDESLLVKRMVSRKGKSKAFINGSLATLQMLSRLGVDLISISGQHEHQILLQVDKHIDILDLFGDLLPLRELMEKKYRKLREISRRLDALRGVEKDKIRRKELLRFQIKEIEDARLEQGEDERLQKEEKVLSNAQKISELASAAYEAIYQGPGSALERLRESLAKFKGVVSLDDSTGPIFSTLETTVFQLEDTAQLLSTYLRKVPFDPGRLEEIEARLDEISKLKRKYGRSLEEVIHCRQEVEKELEQVEMNEQELNRLENQKWEVEKKVRRDAWELSKRRSRAASQLSKKVEDEFSSLGMKKTTFRVTVEKTNEKTKCSDPHDLQGEGLRLTEKGIDVVEFLISPNPGEELRPLAKIASGGELSRIILALKRVVAQGKGPNTLIFDEVDSGIGGATAEVVGRKLKEMARQQQTLCITHLPQIASFADLHHSVYKRIQNGRTLTLVKLLASSREREEELARMLGGTTITAKTREYAREMLKDARRRVQEVS